MPGSSTPASPPPSEEAVWVEGELIRSMMGAVRSTQYVGALMVPVVFGIGVHAVHLPWLIGWCAGALLLWLARVRISALYLREAAGSGTVVQQAFLRRFGVVFVAGGFWWGGLALLFLDRTPVDDQFLCWLMIAGAGALSINSYSACLPVLRRYIAALMLTSLGVIAWRILETGFASPPYHYWMMVLGCVLWHLMLRGGTRLHAAHRRNTELLYRNDVLIESLKRQTQAALDAVAVKNRFLASATHDIRQPVHALALYADWLRNEPELVNEIAPKIVQATRAVNALFDSLFDFAKLDSGRMRTVIETIDVAGLLRELELQYRPLAEAKGLDFRLRVREGTVVSDPIRLRRILGNLLSNAIKYTARGGVLLGTRRTAHGLRFEVWDTGVGIAPAHQRRVFTEFYKVPAHAGTDEGFGLGLAIVARVARSMAHPIGMKSRPGRGSVFSVTVEGASEAEVRARVAHALDQAASNSP